MGLGSGNAFRRSLVRYGGFVFSIGAARCIGILISSLTFPFLVHRLGVEVYGYWSYVVAVVAFVTTLSNPGLTVYATQQVAARRTDAFDLIPNILALRSLASATSLGILLIVAAFEGRPDVRHILRFYGAVLLLINLTGVDYLMEALELFHARSLLVIFQQSLYAVGIFVTIRGPNDVFWLPASILISVLVANSLGWIVLWKQGFRFTGSVRAASWKAILIPSSHYAMSSMMSNLYHRSGQIIVRWFLGGHELGIYAAAVRFLEIMQQFVTIVLNVLMPRMALSAKSKNDVVRLTRLGVSVIALLSIPMVLGLISTSHLIVPWAMGASFAEAVSLLRWMSPYILVASTASLFSGTVLYATGRYRAYLAATSSGAVAGLAAYLILIPALGLKGAAFAFMVGQFVVTAVAYLLIPAEVRNSWKSPLIVVAFAASLLMVLVVRLVNHYNDQPLLVLSAGALVYILTCVWPIGKWLVREFGGLQTRDVGQTAPAS